MKSEYQIGSRADRMNNLQFIGALIVLATSSIQSAQTKPTTEIVANTKPTVVTIQTFDSNRQPIGLGTGFFISGSQIVTNSHVVKDAEYLRISDLYGNKYTLDKVIADDRVVDLAILSVAGNHPFLNVDLTACVEGENVLVIGNPEGLQGTVTTGIISAIRSDINRYQISAPISPGSSGSPVLNENGDVIGVVVSQFREGQNLNFAIPAWQIGYVRTKGLQSSDDSRNPDAEVTADPWPTANPPPADDARSKIASLIYRYLDATQNGKPISLYPFCTLELVEWYGQKNVSISWAEKAIAEYYRVWPYQTVQFNIKDLHINPVRTAANTFLAWIPFDWTASNGKKRVVGHSIMQAMVVLTSNGYGYRIAAIRNVKTG